MYWAWHFNVLAKRWSFPMSTIYEEVKREIEAYRYVIANRLLELNRLIESSRLDRAILCIDALIATLPPSIREEIIEKKEELERERDAQLEEIRLKALEIRSPYSRYHFYNTHRTTILYNYVVKVIEVITSALDRHGLLIAKRRVEVGGLISFDKEGRK